MKTTVEYIEPQVDQPGLYQRSPAGMYVREGEVAPGNYKYCFKPEACHNQGLFVTEGGFTAIIEVWLHGGDEWKLVPGEFNLHIQTEVS